jgi:DNA-binding transcriptional MerR regulator
MNDTRTAAGEPPYLTVDDLAERYQVPISTVRYWRLNGLGPKAVKIGRFVRYKIDDVLAWEKQLQASAR